MQSSNSCYPHLRAHVPPTLDGRGSASRTGRGRFCGCAKSAGVKLSVWIVTGDLCAGPALAQALVVDKVTRARPQEGHTHATLAFAALLCPTVHVPGAAASCHASLLNPLVLQALASLSAVELEQFQAEALDKSHRMETDEVVPAIETMGSERQAEDARAAAAHDASLVDGCSSQISDTNRGKYGPAQSYFVSHALHRPQNVLATLPAACGRQCRHLMYVCRRLSQPYRQGHWFYQLWNHEFCLRYGGYLLCDVAALCPHTRIHLHLAPMWSI